MKLDEQGKKGYTFGRLINDIKIKNIKSSYIIASKTVELLENLITDTQWSHAQHLMDLIKEQIDVFTLSIPTEYIPLNVMRHALKIIRIEYETILKESNMSSHLGDFTKPLADFKSLLLDHLSEYRVELECSSDVIAHQGSEIIRPDEVILTFGKSNTVKKFLMAAKGKKIEVVVCENSPSLDGHQMVAELVNEKINSALIPDTNIFAIMPRINKIVVGVNSVMADGSLRSQCGINGLAIVAKQFSVPVIVLVQSYKLTPKHMSLLANPTDPFYDCISPAGIMSAVAGQVWNGLSYHKPTFDFIKVNLINTYITQHGASSPTVIHKIFSELYDSNDI